MPSSKKWMSRSLSLAKQLYLPKDEKEKVALLVDYAGTIAKSHEDAKHLKNVSAEVPYP